MKMSSKILMLLFLFLSFSGNSQNFYQTKIYDSLEEDIDYQEVIEKLDTLYEEVNFLFPKISFSIPEQAILKEVIACVDHGYDSLLIKELEKPAVKKLLESYAVDEQALINIAQKIKPLKDRKGKIGSIYMLKEIVFGKKIELPEDLSSIKELRKYKLKNDEKILEIGAGSTEFSRLIGSKVSDCEVYLNELDSVSLKNIFYGLNYHPQIKKSMDEHTELIIKERFPEDCKIRCCDHLLSRNDFLTMMLKNGFTKTYDKKMTKEDGGKFWVYKFKLGT